MHISLNDFLLTANIRKTLEYLIEEAIQIRRKIISQSLPTDNPKSIGTRFYENLKEKIIFLSRNHPDLGIFILEHEAFSFYICNRAFEVRYCRDVDDKIPAKRFRKVGLDSQYSLFEPAFSSDFVQEMNLRHFYIVFKANALMECHAVSLNEYIDGKVVDSIDLTYLRYGENHSTALVDESSTQKQAVNIPSAAEDLDLLDDLESAISLKNEVD